MSTSENRPADMEVSELRHVQVSLTDVEIRTPGETGGDWFTLEGHASVFSTPTTLYKGATFSVVETIAPGAFTEVLATNPDVHLNVNHDSNLVMARTGVVGVGGLELSEDAQGLRVYAKIDSTVSYISDLAKLMKSGVVNQMSFAFKPGRTSMVTNTDETGYETDLITQESVELLADVCVTPRGAYPTTDASVRSLIEQRTAVRSRATERATDVATEKSGTEHEIVAQSDVGVTNEERINARKLEVRKILAKANHPTPRN